MKIELIATGISVILGIIWGILSYIKAGGVSLVTAIILGALILGIAGFVVTFLIHVIVDLIASVMTYPKRKKEEEKKRMEDRINGDQWVFTQLGSEFTCERCGKRYDINSGVGQCSCGKKFIYHYRP